MKKKIITMSEYNALMSEIIKKGKPVADTLVEMLEECSKYDICGDKIIDKKFKKGKKKSHESKRPPRKHQTRKKTI